MALKDNKLRLFAPLINLFVDSCNLFVHRNKKIILFGSWMGDKFADNSRYIYQYLSENKKKYGLDKVIWATRNNHIYDELKKNNYEVYMMHSFASFYYHIKAGVYCICNMAYSESGYLGDVMGHLAGHATKINTWHGIPIKSGKSTGTNMLKRGLKGKIVYTLRNSKFFCSLFTPAHWDKCFYLSTGKECTKRLSLFLGTSEDHFIETGYPRNCELDFELNKERDIISSITKFDKTILYAPTFREGGKNKHPLDNNDFLSYIINNNILWIEKPHSASFDKQEKIKRDNILYLSPNFDINVILNYISLVITDYSSICFDAMAKKDAVLFYAYDYEHYKNEERGFLCNYKELCGDSFCTSLKQLQFEIDSFYNNGSYHSKLIKKSISEYHKVNDIDFNELNLETIVDSIYNGVRQKRVKKCK